MSPASHQARRARALRSAPARAIVVTDQKGAVPELSGRQVGLMA
jgi:hypothetical protein